MGISVGTMAKVKVATEVWKREGNDENEGEGVRDRVVTACAGVVDNSV